MKLIKRIYNRQFNWIDLVPGNWQWELFLCVCMYVVIKSFQTDTVSARIPVASDNKKNPSVQPRNSLSHVNWENLEFNFRYSKTGLKKHIIKLWFSPYLHSVDSIVGLYMLWSETSLDIILTITDLRGATLFSVGIKIPKIQLCWFNLYRISICDIIMWLRNYINWRMSNLYKWYGLSEVYFIIISAKKKYYIHQVANIVVYCSTKDNNNNKRTLSNDCLWHRNGFVDGRKITFLLHIICGFPPHAYINFQ